MHIANQILQMILLGGGTGFLVIKQINTRYRVKSYPSPAWRRHAVILGHAAPAGSGGNGLLRAPEMQEEQDLGWCWLHARLGSICCVPGNALRAACTAGTSCSRDSRSFRINQILTRGQERQWTVPGAAGQGWRTVAGSSLGLQGAESPLKMAGASVGQEGGRLGQTGPLGTL